MTKPNACPFCGGTRIKTITFASRLEGETYPQCVCDTCGARGPYFTPEDGAPFTLDFEALDAWNKLTAKEVLTLPGGANRYTVIVAEGADLPRLVTSAEVLGLEWFARHGAGRVEFYVFFDKQGAANYLTGLYATQGD